MLDRTIFETYEIICRFHNHFETRALIDAIQTMNIISNNLFLFICKCFVDAESSVFRIVFISSFL